MSGDLVFNNDLSTNVGQPNKRAKTGYISKLKRVDQINDMDIVSQYEAGTRVQGDLSEEGTIITIEGLTASNTGVVTATSIDTTREVIVAVGTKTTGGFIAYSSPYPGNTWTTSTSTLNSPWAIRFLSYSPTLDVFVGHDARQIVSLNYVYCTASDLNNWQFLSLPTAFDVFGAAWLPDYSVFIAYGGSSSVPYLVYSYDGLTWSSVDLSSTGLASIKDVCIRTEAPLNSADRVLLSGSAAGSNTPGYYTSTTIFGPFIFRDKSLTASNNYDAIAWNSDKRTYLCIKNASSEFNVKDEFFATPSGATTTGGNKGGRRYLTPSLYVPEIRINILSRLTINAGDVGQSCAVWDGGAVLSNSLHSLPSRLLPASISSNICYVLGKVVYLPSKMTFFAPFYQGLATSSATGVVTAFSMQVYRFTLSMPPTSYPSINYKQLSYLSDKTTFDRFDRLVTTQQPSASGYDYLLGGIGSETYPLKNANFSQSVRISGSGQSGSSLTSRPCLQVEHVQPRGNILDNMRTSAITDMVKKGIISNVNIHTKDWTGDSTFNLSCPTINTYNIKSIGFPLNQTYLLQKDGAIYRATSKNFATYTLETTVGIPGTSIFGNDIAFSPTLNRFVYAGGSLWWADLDTTTGTAFASSFVKSNGISTYISTPNLYGLVEWVPWLGDAGAFITMKTNYLYSSAPHTTNDEVMISFDGKNFEKLPTANPLQAQSTNVNTRFITSYAHDPLTKTFAMCQRADPVGAYGATMYYIDKNAGCKNIRITRDTNFAPPTTAGTHPKIAFSPKLKIWVIAMGVPGTTATAITTNNMWYSTAPNAQASNTFGIPSTWTSVSTKHIGNTQYCNWVDVKWHEGLQMFIAVNTNASSTTGGTPDTTDSMYWYSLDGITWRSVGRNPSLGHPTDDITTLLEEGTQQIEIDELYDSIYYAPQAGVPQVRGYNFDMSKATAVVHQNYQTGVATFASTVTSAVSSLTVTFKYPFVRAPTGILLTPTLLNGTPTASDSLSYWVSDITVNTFKISAIQNDLKENYQCGTFTPGAVVPAGGSVYTFATFSPSFALAPQMILLSYKSGSSTAGDSLTYWVRTANTTTLTVFVYCASASTSIPTFTWEAWNTTTNVSSVAPSFTWEAWEPAP